MKLLKRPMTMLLVVAFTVLNCTVAFANDNAVLIEPYNFSYEHVQNIQPIANEQTTDSVSNIESFHIEENSGIYEFFLNVNIDNLSAEYSDGKPVSAELHSELVRKLGAADFDGVLGLIFQHNLSLQTETVEDTMMAEGRSIAYTTSFSRASSHTLTDLNGGGWRTQGIVTSRGTVTYNADGTITPHGFPNLTMDFWMGDGWSTSISNISSSFQRIENNRAVNVVGGFNMTATFWHFNSFVPVFNANFGRTNIQHRIA